MPFAWGSNDCALFAADAVLAMTGIDHAKDLRAYDSAQAAARLIDSRGGLEAIATGAMGNQIPALMAGPGDVVMHAEGGRPTLAICNGSTLIAPGPDGIVALPMSAAITAWRVG